MKAMAAIAQKSPESRNLTAPIKLQVPMKQRAIFLLAIGLAASACAQGQEAPAPLGAETFQTAAPFRVGASVSARLLRDNVPYRAVLMREHNSITAENAMKMTGLRPTAGAYNFADADLIADFAVSQGKRLHGHTLVWHWSGRMAWLRDFQGDSLAWENLYKDYIQTVVRHYRGRVASWDVVNEAFFDDGTLRVANRSTTEDDGSIWARKLGPDYVARAFRYAREADPNVLLFYNDYGQENNPAKLRAILNLVADFKRRGVPIDGLGLQMHLSLSTSNDAIADAIRQTAGTGLLVHLSELDIAVSNWKKDPQLTYTEALQQAQAEKYRFVAQQYKRLVPPAQQFGITFWNVGDADSWLRSFIQPNEWPLPFDDAYQKKRAYHGFLQGLKE
jgi:endo-1,4-beta-xylanase